jgi:hypothetical protein
MQAIGVTIKAVLEIDENMACELRRMPRHTLRLGGKLLEDVKIGVRPGAEVEPARLWVTLEDVPTEREDDFLDE